MVLDQLTHIALDQADAHRLGQVQSTWILRRAWPRRTDHVLLEYADTTGRTLAGQWFADSDKLNRICRQTDRSGQESACVVQTGTTRIMLQADGADRRLPGIGWVRRRLGPCELLVHRPERRAILRCIHNGTTVFAKVTRPGPSTDAAITAGQLAACSMLGGTHEQALCPQLLSAEPEQGVAIWSKVAGVSLHDLFATRMDTPDDEIERIARSVGTMLKHLHQSPPMPGPLHHSPSDEAAILMRWLDHLRWADPGRSREIAPPIRSVCERLAQIPHCFSPIHRDLHDKQILIDPGGTLGVIDFDTLALGDPALDLGNLIAHAQLRVVQGIWSIGVVERFIPALLDAVRPDVAIRARLGVWIEATRLRLACLYSFRPRWSRLVFEALISPDRAHRDASLVVPAEIPRTRET